METILLILAVAVVALAIHAGIGANRALDELEDAIDDLLNKEDRND